MTEHWSQERVAAYRERVFGFRDRLAAEAAEAAHHQRAVLADLLEHNTDTKFGRAHSFAAIRGLDDYRRAVPIHDYAALEPWIERAAAGEHGVLSADDPVVYFTSSGSTGAHKKIPVTARFMHTTFFPFFYAAWAPMLEHHPWAASQPDAVLNLKHDPRPAPRTTASGRPHLGASQVDFGTAFGEPLSAEPGTTARWAEIPAELAGVLDAEDHHEKAYLRLRLAVEADLRCIIGINPAAVAALPHQLLLWWPRIVREVRDGTVCGRRLGSPDPGRAAELEALAGRFDPVRPAHVWPNLTTIFCWTGGIAALYLPRLAEEFGIGVEVLPAPIAASEGPVAVALDRHASAGSLVVSAAAYEFVDADTPITPDAATLCQEELEPGREYQVVFSHVGGLYRYAGGDVVRVLDRVGGVPRLEYAGRATTSDVAGERLREAHVLRAAASALTAGGLRTRNLTCRTRAAEGETQRYEFAVAPPAPWSSAELTLFAERLDAGLSAQAPGYRVARTSGALAAPVAQQLPPAAFQNDWHRQVEEGIRPAQVKDRMFRHAPDAWERLLGQA